MPKASAKRTIVVPVYLFQIADAVQTAEGSWVITSDRKILRILRVIKVDHTVELRLTDGLVLQCPVIRVHLTQPFTPYKPMQVEIDVAVTHAHLLLDASVWLLTEPSC